MQEAMVELAKMNQRMEREFVAGYPPAWGMARYLMRNYSRLMRKHLKLLQDKIDKLSPQEEELPKGFYDLLNGWCEYCESGDHVERETESDCISARCKKCHALAMQKVEKAG